MLAEKQEVCVVCCRDILIYATGQCDHTVCFDCSTRLRVICKQNECPICRTDVPQVIFTHKKMPFSMPNKKPQFCDDQYGIIFEDKHIQSEYEQLLENRCSICEDEVFPTFDKLNRHTRVKHGLHYCELCIENLKIFPFERKSYSRRDLATHNRKGDQDDTSHRGHPRCEYCEQRFFDKDELFRHLRKEHFFCHFCDADGKFEFYANHTFLKNHFRARHFLCEEDDCAKGEFQFIAFRSEIDFKAHQATEHTRNKTKAEVKQVRTLDLGFSLTPRVPNYGEMGGGHSERYSNYKDNNHNQKRNMEETVTRDVDSAQVQSQVFSTTCDQDFPHLSNDGNKHPGFLNSFSSYSSRVNSSQNQPLKKEVKSWKPKAVTNVEHFPALPTSNFKTTSSNVEGNKAGFKSKNTAQQFSVRASQPLRNRLTPKGNTSSKSKKIPDRNSEEFPELECRIPLGSSHNFNSSVAQAIYNKVKEMPKKSKAVLLEDDEKIERKTNDTVSLSQFCTGLGNLPGDDAEAIKIKERYKEKHRQAYKSDSEEVPWRQKVNFVMADFPTLESTIPKSSGAPPGFGGSHAPPPGFGTKNGMNWNGHKIQADTPPAENSNKYVYQPPEPGFNDRNKMLIEKIKNLTENDELFEEFKVLSGRFKVDILSAKDYHTKCLSVLGKDKFLEIIDELLCLLPDIEKQQGLFNIHKQYLDETKNSTTENQKKQTTLLTCPMCHQVLCNTDILSHIHQ